MSDPTVTGLPPRSAPADAPEIILHARQLIFENTVFSVFADHIADRQGHAVERYLSVIPKSLVGDTVAGVAVLPIYKDRMGLIQIFRHPQGRRSWEAIKGHVDADEPARAAAARELHEEAGLSAAPEQFIDLGAAAPEAGVIKARTRLFSVTLDDLNADAKEGELGHGVMAFYSRDEIHALIDTGDIEDASTLALLFKYQLHQIASAQL